MRYWRLFFVSFLLTFPIAGCHRKVEQALPPPQAQAPAITLSPSLPPLVLEPVILAGATPEPAAPPPVQVAPLKKRAAKVHHRLVPNKPEPASEPTDTHPSGSSVTSASAIIGQLSADDATASASDIAQTKHLIDATTNKLKKLSSKQQKEHKEAVAQVASFLAQARQALGMNDVVGAQTLANKARILVDELPR